MPTKVPNPNRDRTGVPSYMSVVNAADMSSPELTMNVFLEQLQCYQDLETKYQKYVLILVTILFNLAIAGMVALGI